MKTALAAVAVLLALSVCARAQQDFFGLTPEDAQGMMAKAMADQARHEAELAQKRAKKAQGPGFVDQALRTYATIADAACDFAAVSRHLGLLSQTGPAPKVYLESRTTFEDFETYVFNEDGSWPQKFTTTYLPKADVIFLDDHGSLYSAQKSIDDALAEQYAAAILMKRGAPAETAKAQAATVEAWFHGAYTASGKSACEPAQ